MIDLRLLGRRAVLVLGTGYVLYFFSERVFWSFWRPDDEVATIAGGWLLYSLFGYLLLAALVWFRVRSLWAAAFVGAGFGWLGEGIVAMTLYGDPSMPFPYTLAWTGLAWHMPVVLVGLLALRKTLLHHAVMPTVALSLMLGLFWGFWAISWGRETPPVSVGFWQFLAHAGVSTLGLAAAQLAIGFGGAANFSPSRWGLGIAITLVAAFLALVTIPTVWCSPLVLAPIAGLLFWGLQRNRLREKAGSVLDDWARPVRLRNLAMLPIMPISAAILYSTANAAGWLPPSHQIVAFTFSPLATIFFVVSIFKIQTFRAAA